MNINQDIFSLQTPQKKVFILITKNQTMQPFFFMVTISTHSTLWHYRKIKNYQGPFLGKVNIKCFRSEISAQFLWYLLSQKGASPYPAQDAALDPIQAHLDSRSSFIIKFMNLGSPPQESTFSLFCPLTLSTLEEN